jgi:hypothetical protein
MTNTTVTTRHGSTSLWTPGDQVSLGSYSTHAQAQSVVEYLADQKFEVETTQIIGTDLRMVEQITGRLTWPRALFGGIFAAVSYGLVRGRRDFTSMSAVVPSRFDVLVAAEHSERARGILAASPR